MLAEAVFHSRLGESLLTARRMPRDHHGALHAWAAFTTLWALCVSALLLAQSTTSATRQPSKHNADLQSTLSATVRPPKDNADSKLLADGPTSIPRSKKVFEAFDVLFHHQGDGASLAWTDKPGWIAAMAPFFDDDFVYDFIHPLPMTRGLSGWFDGEHTVYNTAFGGYNSSVFLAAGSDDAITCAAFHLSTWHGPFAGVPAPDPPVRVHVKDLDFYQLVDDRIVSNWCMIDVIDVLRQGGVRVLPQPAPLRDDGLYPPPRAVDGLPAPNSVYVEASLAGRRAEMEALLWRAIRADLLEQDGRALHWAADAAWYGPGGIGRATSRDEYATHFLRPLYAAFRPLAISMDLLVCEATYCGAHFKLLAHHSGPWLGVPPTHRNATIRFGMHTRLAVDADGCALATTPCIAEAWAQVDVLAAFASVGVDLLEGLRVL